MVAIIVSVVSGLCTVICAVILANQHKSERKRENEQERMELLMECTEATLYGVHDLGANGRTTDAINRLEKYKNQMAAK